MSKNILTPVSNSEYDFYLESIQFPNYYPEHYSRLAYSIKVISEYLEKKGKNNYFLEDVIFELKRSYNISLEWEKVRGAKELAFSIVKVISYAYQALKLSVYRKGKKAITKPEQMLGILHNAVNHLVSQDYESSYGKVKAGS